MPHSSDHCHRSFVIKANFIDRDSLETSTELTLTEYNRLFWNIKSNDRLKGGIKSQTVQSRLQAAVKHDSIDIASELMTELWWKHAKKLDGKRKAAKLNANNKTNGSIGNAKRRKETCNTSGRKFLKSLIIRN